MGVPNGDGTLVTRRDLDLMPRGLSRSDAARYIGVGVTLFDDLVARGLMPRPRSANSRRVWDRYEIDAAFDDLPYAGDLAVAAESEKKNSWDVLCK